MNKERIEALECILDELGIEITSGNVEIIVRDFCMHLEMESEMSSYQHSRSHNQKDPEIIRLEKRIKELESDLSKSEQDFKKNVAMRRNCAPEDVTILGDGKAEYHY